MRVDAPTALTLVGMCTLCYRACICSCQGAVVKLDDPCTWQVHLHAMMVPFGKTIWHHEGAAFFILACRAAAEML